ncbi:MAG TPA: hypothetical protein VK495_03365, partial [Steroidobacteraceae bacterium]|nr:hypothetical protein [Steroidobacteraceae bacterium]
MANEAIRRLRPVGRSNFAAALILALMAGSMATGRASAASPGDNEIRIGNTMPYTGPASSYGIIGKTIAAYFDKIN